MKMHADPCQPESGFSLVELLVAMAIGLVLLGTVLSIYLGTSVAGRQSDTVSRMNEDAAIALDVLARHIRMAGYSEPLLMAGRNAATANAAGQVEQFSDSNLAGEGLKGCDGGFDSTTANWNNLSCKSSNTGPDAIAVRYQGDSYNTEPNASNNATDCLGQAVSQTTASAVSGSPAYVLVEARLFINSKQELSCAGNGGGDANTSPSYTSQPLVSGVEKMRLLYGVASDSTENQIVRFATAADINGLGGTTDQNWGQVVAVRICIQMVSANPDQGQTVMYYDCDGTSKTPTDKYLHRVFSTTVSIRNRVRIAQ